MSRFHKSLALIFAFLFVAVGATILLFDWDMLRGYVERQVTKKTGREFSIGQMDVDLSFTPRIYLKNIKLANASWSKERLMLDIDAADFTLDIRKFIGGHMVLPDVVLSNPKVMLEESPSGERNWVLKQDQEKSAPPVITRLRIDKGALTFYAPAIKTDVRAELNTDSVAADPTSAMKFHANGTFKGLQLHAEGQGGSVLSLQNDGAPYPIQATGRIGDTSADIKGSISEFASLSALDLAFKLRGQDMSKLYPLSGVVIPPTPPYSINGRLIRDGPSWRLNNFSGKVGDSDLAGDIHVDSAGVRPSLTGELRSRVLDIDDLAGIIGAPPKTGPGETASPAQKQSAAKLAMDSHVLPDKPFRLNRLRAMDADVKFKADSIRREGLPLDNLFAHVVLRDGVLKLAPLNFGVAGGQLASNIALNGKLDKPTVEVNTQFNKLRLNELFPGVELTRTSAGTLSGSAGLSGEGNSFAKLLASADGEIAAVMTGGKISNLLLEVVGIDGGEIIKYLLGGDRNATIRCAVADFKVTDGVMKTNVFVFDTTDTNITGEGVINLQNETLDLRLNPLPKDKSILSIRSPLNAKGSFKNPDFAPDKEALAARGGAALLLGALVNPLVALIPLIETGPGKDSDCQELIATATKDMKKAAKVDTSGGRGRNFEQY